MTGWTRAQNHAQCRDRVCSCMWCWHNVIKMWRHVQKFNNDPIYFICIQTARKLISWYVAVALVQVFHKSCCQFFPWVVDSLVSGECDWEATGWLSKSSLPFHPWNYQPFPSAPQELGSQHWNGTLVAEMSFSVELWGQSGRIWTIERDEESFCRKWHTFQKGFCSSVFCLIDKRAQENLQYSFPPQPLACMIAKVN